jgi:hypothetical protein
MNNIIKLTDYELKILIADTLEKVENDSEVLKNRKNVLNKLMEAKDGKKE